MNLLPFGRLPIYCPRRFVPVDADLGNWDQIVPLFDRLELEAARCGGVGDLEKWLLDWSEHGTAASANAGLEAAAGVGAGAAAGRSARAAAFSRGTAAGS